MSRAIRRLFVFFAVLFLALIAQLTYVQVYAAPELRVHANNTRALEAEMRVERGLIVSADGVELAGNHKEGDYYLRTYPEGALASPLLGYSSIRYGRAGVERVYNPELSGGTPGLSVDSVVDWLTGRPRRGADLHLTLDSRVQRVADEALAGRRGAVVALDPRTGAILALVSSPSYDPNDLEKEWEALQEDPDRPLIDRALIGLYPPGSAFKPVVAAAGLEQGVVEPDTSFTDEGEWLVGGFKVRNYGGKTYGDHDFTDGMVDSVNTTFAKVGVEVGAEGLADTAKAFGFDHRVPWRLPTAVSPFPDPGGMDEAHVAQVAFGQGELLSTPLEMAFVAAAIANRGEIMEPFLVSEVRDYHQALVEKHEPRVWLTATTAEVAAQVRDMMVQVVERGTGTKAAIPGVQVAGKTGTAELDQGEPHAWFIGFAPADDPQVAVAVIVENAGTGGSVAAPIARDVMAAALAR